MSKPNIEIRACKTQTEFARCVELQREVWEFNDLDLVPKDIFIVAVKTGGQVLGAFDGSVQAGFAIAFPAIREGQTYLHSHMLAVLPDYRDQGVGRQLKLKQREDALARGMDLIEWTFDPMELKNAYFNIQRLGVIVRRYIQDQYGRTSSPLHAGLPTDRLVAEWWLSTARVKAAMNGQPHTPGLEVLRVTIPRNIGELRHTDVAAAGKVFTKAREEFEHGLEPGRAITGFTLDETTGSYLLEPYED